MAKELTAKFKNRADTSTNWAIVNPILELGELGLETNTNKIKFGDGVTTWNSLVYAIENSSENITVRLVVGTSTSGWTEKDCDYLCDGTADQTEINAAITALPATGGEIVILDGTYNITAKIDVTKDNVSIKGNGNATILKRMFDSSVKEGVITLTGRSGCKIANLQIEGNKATYTASYNYGIYIYSSSDNNTVTGNTCNNNNSGIYLDGSDNNTVTGNTCNNNTYGIRLFSSSNNTITGNTCNNNSDYGIYLYSSSSNNTITGNTCNNNNSGIYLDGSDNNTITGNTCIRGTGLATDYTASQYTMRLAGTDNNYNLISNNNCMGKAVTNEGGTGNTLVNNKWNATSDFEDLRTDVGDKTTLTTTDKTNLVNAVNETKAQINDLDAEVDLKADTEHNHTKSDITDFPTSMTPISHASSGTTYGVGTTTNFGHCKTINNLTQASHIDGTALSAYQGKVLNDKIINGAKILYGTYTGDGTATRTISLPFTPVFVIIKDASGKAVTFVTTTGALRIYSDIRNGSVFTTTTNGFIVGADPYVAINSTDRVYEYIAF